MMLIETRLNLGFNLRGNRARENSVFRNGVKIIA